MFDWSRFIKLGKILFERLDEESIRTAISRFYYGVFGVVRRYLINVENKYYLERSDSDVHRDVYGELCTSVDTTLNQIAVILNKLRFVRNHADYDDGFDVEYFEKFCQENKKKLVIAFNALNYLKSHPNY